MSTCTFENTRNCCLLFIEQSKHHFILDEVKIISIVLKHNASTVSCLSHVHKWDEWMIGWMDDWMNGWMDEWMIGWMDDRMNGWIKGWMDG